MSDYLAPNKDVIFINSRDRDSGTSSDFIINLQPQVRIPNAYDSIVLLSATIPKSWYLITTLNNSFTVQENSSPVTITIPSGNYTFTTLATELSSLFSANLSFTYAITTNTQTGKFTFTASGNGSTQPIFNFTGSSPYLIMGFEQSSYTFSANTLSSVNVVNFQLTNTVAIICDIVQQPGNILGIVVSDNQDFANVSYIEQAPEFSSKPLNNNKMQSMHVFLQDPVSELPLDLNGINWSCTLCLYKVNDYYQRILQDKLYQVSKIKST